MHFPIIDCEMTYWRLRHRTRKLRGMLRAWASRGRARAHLDHLHLFGRLPERPQPEDTVVYRALWAVAVLGLVVALGLESFNDGTFADYADAIAARCVVDTDALAGRVSDSAESRLPALPPTRSRT